MCVCVFCLNYMNVYFVLVIYFCFDCKLTVSNKQTPSLLPKCNPPSPILQPFLDSDDVPGTRPIQRHCPLMATIQLSILIIGRLCQYSLTWNIASLSYLAYFTSRDLRYKIS